MEVGGGRGRDVVCEGGREEAEKASVHSEEDQDVSCSVSEVSIVQVRRR